MARVAAEVDQRAGHHDGQALEGARRRTRRARPPCARRRAAHFVDDRVVPVDSPSNHSTHRLGDRRADALGGGEPLLGRPPRIAVHRAELGGQRPGGGRADVPDRERRPAPATAARPWPASRLSSSRWPLAESTGPSPSPFFGARVNSGARQQRRPRRGRRRRPRRRSRRRRAARPPPRSRAPRCRRRRGRRRGRPARAPGPGSCWWLGQRRSLSPSFCSTSVVPQDGHSVGITHSAQALRAAARAPGRGSRGSRRRPCAGSRCRRGGRPCA